MPTFTEEAFPYRFECLDCPYGNAVEVIYREAVDLAPEGGSPREAVNFVLVKRGWWEYDGRRLCPECMEDLD